MVLKFKTLLYIAHLRQVGHNSKIWNFWVIGIERNVCWCTFNRYSVITQFAKLAVGDQLCGRCTHTKLQHFKTFKSLSWKITYFELWHCCGKRAICVCERIRREWFYRVPKTNLLNPVPHSNANHYSCHHRMRSASPYLRSTTCLQ